MIPVARGVLALVVGASAAFAGIYFKLPILGGYPLEALLLINGIFFFWRPVYALNGMKIGEAMQQAPAVAALSLAGAIMLTLGALLFVFLRTINP